MDKWLKTTKIIYLIMFLLAIALAFILSTIRNSSTEEIKAGKIIEWGWGTPDPSYVKEHIKEMEKVPFDGLVFDISINPQTPNPYPETGMLSWSIWGHKLIKYEDYSVSINNLKSIKSKIFTDNFIRLNVVPGSVDWYDDEGFTKVLQNIKLVAEIAKESGLKGILFDVEQYKGQLFEYSKQVTANNHTFKDYKDQVRQRGREFIQTINSVYPDITLLLTFGYYIAYNFTPDYENSFELSPYGLLPSFLDGMLESAGPDTIIYDGWEYSYCYKQDQDFQTAVSLIKNKSLEMTEVPENFIEHYRSSFGLWIDCKREWDEADLTKNYFSPDAFESSLRSALRYTDRYVWIYSESARWWEGGNQNNHSFKQIPQTYINALKMARKS